jgi:diguanylate cyclase (GGDEF)-like protein
MRALGLTPAVDLERRRSDHPLMVVLVPVLGRLAWLPIAMLAVVLMTAPVDSPLGMTAAQVATGLGFALFLARLVCAAVVWRDRRAPLSTLTLAMVLYGTGALVLTATPDSALYDFPSPSSVFFLSASAATVTYLALDSLAHAKFSAAAALEAVVTCGGAACLAGAVLLIPLTEELDNSGIPLIGALLYPLIDLLMVMIVITASTLQGTLRSSRTVKSLAGFVLLTAADVPLLATANNSLLAKVAGPHSDLSSVIYLLWGSAMVLITAGACSHRGEAHKYRAGAWEAVPPIAAAFLATLVLTLRPPGISDAYTTGPALVTLFAAACRMALALREARNAAEAFRLSLTDDLTGLPNRRAVVHRMKTLAHEDQPIGLLLLDIDRFKDINDTLGHVAGDRVLQLLARRLRSWLPATSTVARLGGDEFAVVTSSEDPSSLVDLAERLRGLIDRPISFEKHSFLLTASVGVAIGDGRTSAEDLLRQADIAMYQAKEQDGDVLLYDPEKDEFTADRLKVADRLRRGIPDKQLRVWYQPQVESSTLAIHGFEALVRWQHPDMGLLFPGDFLPVARQTNLMAQLTEEVVELILADAGRWAARGIAPKISFNIAPQELLNAQLLHHVLSKIDEAELPADSLVIEVTEDSFLADPHLARRALEQIAEHRIQVAIDDYGTGFSSLQYIRDLPVHELKMDRSFVNGIGHDPRSLIIVSSTNQMAHGLGLRTVAEGVEDEDAAYRLATLGVDILQGYHIARPMPAQDVEPWLRRWQEARTQQSATASAVLR